MNREHIGISSWAYPWAVGVAGYEQPSRPMDAFGLLEKARELGAGVLQIEDNLPLHALGPNELDTLAAAARGCDITLEAGTKGLSPDNLLRYLDIALRIGARLVRTLPHDGSDRPGLEEAAARLMKVMPEYESNGVTLAVENHDFYPSKWLAELMERVNGPAICPLRAAPAARPCILGVCLDPVNNFGQGESERDVFANLARFTVNFHCKDYMIARKPSMLGFDVEGAPLGSGRLDLKAAKTTLRPGISWVIESWTPWRENIRKTIQLEDEWARAGVGALRGV
ncbi:MAG: sugar phosphate isomerase/epimerase [Defluviitaleaceae bacterium]|nr:sugar phosphate isomerase/epimerase [Defluviitaleaceae bacterium]